MAEVIFSDATTVTRSKEYRVNKGDAITVHISGAATVEIIENPFKVAAKDNVLETITASTSYESPANFGMVIDITANTGTVNVTLVR